MKKSSKRIKGSVGIFRLHTVLLCMTVCGCFLWIPDENPLTLGETQLKYIEATTNTITVGWKTVPLAEEYVLRVSTETKQYPHLQGIHLSDPQKIYIESTGRPFHVYILENLEPDTTYYMDIYPEISSETTTELGYDFSGSMASDILDIRTSAE
jgi:hypothetical protein